MREQLVSSGPPRLPVSMLPANRVTLHAVGLALLTTLVLALAGVGLWTLVPPAQRPGQRDRIASPAVAIGSRLAGAVVREAARRSELLIPDWPGTERITFLAMGLDQRTNEPPRTDTLLVVSIDPARRSAAMISVPRDLYVSIPGYGYDRVNEAYRVGGPDLARRVVSDALQVPIPYYVVVDFRGFQRIIDTLGGVEIDVEQPIYDTKYPAQTGNGYITVDIKAGRHHMDGDTALKYARSRMADPEGDFGRSKRQQRLLLGSQLGG